MMSAAAPVTAPRAIALVGAECTGKTSLAVALARNLPALWLPEVLREFCEQRARTPHRHEQAGLMHDQIRREARLLVRAARVGFDWVAIDSTPLVTALYSQLLFDDDSLLAAGIEHQRRYAVTLLADIDLPWVPDGIQRDGPLVRERFHRLLARTLEDNGIAHVTISGPIQARCLAAARAVRAIV